MDVLKAFGELEREFRAELEDQKLAQAKHCVANDEKKEVETGDLPDLRRVELEVFADEEGHAEGVHGLEVVKAEGEENGVQGEHDSAGSNSFKVSVEIID